MEQELDLRPYLEVARKSRIVWMDGREVGMIPVRFRAKYPILLWPYKAPTFLELVSFFTHEVVHHTNPEFDSNEGAVEALTAKLMRDIKWTACASVKVGAGLHSSVCKLFKKNEVSIDI